MAASKTPTYVLGHTESELRRLALQGQYWGEVTLEVLEKSGLTSGMRVLDIGCGAGDVSLLAANLVGSSGAVIGIDRSPEAVERASARAASLNIDHLRFEVAEAESIDSSLNIDAIVGRFVLMYMPNPTAVLRELVTRLKPEIVAFIEMDMRVARSVPTIPHVEKAIGWVTETFKRAGAALDLGPQLWRIFRDAGLDEHNMVVCQKLEPAYSTAGVKMLSDIVLSLLPMMERFGVVTNGEVDVETLAKDLQNALSTNDAALLPPCVVGAYGRIVRS